MFDGQPYRDELLRRLGSIRNVLDAADPTPPAPPGQDIGRELRGFVILLLFASYENLLTSLCRGLLEAAVTLRVGNRRLRRGFRQFAVHHHFKSIADASAGKLWKDSGPQLLDCIFDSRQCTVNTDTSPADGSFMKRSQVSLFCDIFELGDPGTILKEVWGRLDTIVTERNGIAHGRLTPEEVGRNYSLADVQCS